jgi:methylenetetrahydrofolate reductase (NADPH)
MKTKFCIGVAGYPEKHFEAPNMESDLKHLKAKVEAGADYIITQMFFDNAKYFSFVNACREIGINVPIIPGLKPVYTKKQLTILPKTFHIDLPTPLSEAVQACKTDLDVEKIGEEWMIEQSKELKKAGVPVLHYYTLGRPTLVANVVKEVF